MLHGVIDFILGRGFLLAVTLAVTRTLIGAACLFIAVAVIAGKREHGQRAATWSLAVFCGLVGFSFLVDALSTWVTVYSLPSLVLVAAVTTLIAAPLTMRGVFRQWLAAVRGRGVAQQRGVELAAARDELAGLAEDSRDVERSRSELYESVAQELRAPLALMLGPAERLSRDPTLAEPERRDADAVVRQARLLMKHVDDLLDIARIDAGRLEPEVQDVDVAALVRRVVAHFEPMADERGVKLHVEAPEKLRAELDANKLSRVLLSLLSNAFKFTSPHGVVRCSVRGLPGERLIVEVADSGAGVALELRERIFERFSRRDSHAGVAGLGLTIAREFVALHGGTIRVDDAPEGGALFIVELPRWAKSSAKRATSTSEGSVVVDTATRHAVDELRTRLAPVVSGSHEAPLVVVVEDDEEINRLVCESIAPLRTESALNGRVGFELALTLKPDLIITDISMPEMRGDELVKRVRAHPDLASIPILLLAAKADDDVRIRLLSEGAQDSVHKPISVDELRARVSTLTAIKRTHDLLQGEVETPLDDVEALAREVVHRKHELQGVLKSLRLTRAKS